MFDQGVAGILTQTNYSCYYCSYNTDDENQYLRHGVRNHLYLPMFPNEGDLERHKLTPQGKPWEIFNVTLEEAERRLKAWAEKSGKPRNTGKKEEKGKEVKVHI